MKVTFADSFWDSLKVMSRHQTWWYKTYAVFRYKIPMFIENLWFFRKELWSFRSWDYTFNLDLFRRSLEKTSNTIEHHGQEVIISRIKKVDKINRVIFLLSQLREDNFISMAEKELGELKNSGWDRDDTDEESEHNSKVFARAREIEESSWNEIWNILRGQNYDEYRKMVDELSPEEMKKKDLWNDWFDGSGIRGWWD